MTELLLNVLLKVDKVKEFNRFIYYGIQDVVKDKIVEVCDSVEKITENIKLKCNPRITEVYCGEVEES